MAVKRVQIIKNLADRMLDDGFPLLGVATICGLCLLIKEYGWNEVGMDSETRNMMFTMCGRYQFNPKELRFEDSPDVPVG